MINDTSNLKEHFILNPNITFLNHGSYGACPISVFEENQKWQRKMERDPVKFMHEDVYGFLEKSRERLGNYINCDKDSIIYFPNPTHAVASVIDNIKVKKNDEVLSTNLEYGSCDRMWFYHSKIHEYKYVQSNIQMPILDKESFLKDFWSSLSKKTKFVFISHITSGTAMLLPIREIIEESKRLGLYTIIDGAHAPGQIPLDIIELDPDYYIGACHKWMCAPKGSSFLYVRKELQDNMEPYLKSWGWGSEFDEFKNTTQHKSKSLFQNKFQWQGTRDMSAFLTVPKAIEFQENYNWNDVIRRCKNLIVDTRNEITTLTGIPKICPDDFLIQMTTIVFPFIGHLELKQLLYNDYQIEIPTYYKDGITAFRISIQGYNTTDDADYLVKSLHAIMNNKNGI